jgi:hypothetical protein
MPVSSLRFEVEQTAQIAYQLPVVVARLLTADVDVVVTGTSTLDGCPVANCLEIPPGRRADGSPRVDLFAFALANEEDLARFAPGQIVTLDAA